MRHYVYAARRIYKLKSGQAAAMMNISKDWYSKWESGAFLSEEYDRRAKVFMDNHPINQKNDLAILYIAKHCMVTTEFLADELQVSIRQIYHWMKYPEKIPVDKFEQMREIVFAFTEAS
jgi:hypothetical protein